MESNGTPDGHGITTIYLPEGVNQPGDLWMMLDQVIGQNVRLYAHRQWHETQNDDTLHPTGITIRYAQIQALLDYADTIDPRNHPTTNNLLEHFGWRIPREESDVPD